MFIKTGNSPIIATSENQIDLSEKKSDETKEEVSIVETQVETEA